MYVSDPAFDPEEMGGTMMTPVIMVIHILCVSFGSLIAFLIMRRWQSRILGREISFLPLKGSEDRSRMDEEHQPLREDLHRNGGIVDTRAVELSGIQRAR